MGSSSIHLGALVCDRRSTDGSGGSGLADRADRIQPGIRVGLGGDERERHDGHYHHYRREQYGNVGRRFWRRWHLSQCDQQRTSVDEHSTREDCRGWCVRRISCGYWWLRVSPGTDQGVTSSQINVAATVINIVGPAANSTFGVPTPAQQQADFQAVINSINASGGVACRKIVPTYYQVDPADQSGLEQSCLQIVQSDPFAEIDAGGYSPYPSLADCFMENGDPYFSTLDLSDQQRDQFYPYAFGTDATFELLYHNAVYGFQSLGVFNPSNGFKKLGFVYRTCVPNVVSEFSSWLSQVGVTSSQIVSYNFGCPSAYASPSDVEQAVLDFKQAGVTNVTEVGDGPDFPEFTSIAQGQGFDPKYDLPDDGIVATSEGSPSDNYSNINGAIAVTDLGYGEPNTPGVTPLPGTAKCNAIYQAAGIAPVYQQPVGFGGAICNEMWMFAAAVDHAPALKRDALAAGLEAAGSVAFSYPGGPNSFAGPDDTTGGQYWRPIQFSSSCTCWTVLNPTWQPSFAGAPS